MSHTPTLWFCCLLSPRGHPRKPLLEPSCLCLQQLPSISITEPSPKTDQRPQLLRAERGHRRTAPATLGAAALSLIHHTLTTGMSSLPTPGRARAAPQHQQPNQVWPLPAASPSPGKEQAAPKEGRSLGAHPEPNLLQELASSSVGALVIY